MAFIGVIEPGATEGVLAGVHGQAERRAGRMLTVFVGFFLTGYLAYEYIHYAMHKKEPRSGLAEFLRRHHLIHHAHGHAGNFGVSTPLWDWLLGTRLHG